MSRFMRECMFSLRLDFLRSIGLSERRDWFIEICRYFIRSRRVSYLAKGILRHLLAMQLGLQLRIRHCDHGRLVSMFFSHSRRSLLYNLTLSRSLPLRHQSQETCHSSSALILASAVEYTTAQSLSFQQLLDPRKKNPSLSSSMDHTVVPPISSNTIPSFSSPAHLAQHSPSLSFFMPFNLPYQNVSVASSFYGSSSRAPTSIGSPRKSNLLYSWPMKRE